MSEKVYSVYSSFRTSRDAMFGAWSTFAHLANHERHVEKCGMTSKMVPGSEELLDGLAWLPRCALGPLQRVLGSQGHGRFRQLPDLAASARAKRYYVQPAGLSGNTHSQTSLKPRGFNDGVNDHGKHAWALDALLCAMACLFACFRICTMLEAFIR